MLDNIEKIVDKFDLFIFDMFGVVWDGKSLFNGVLSLMERLKKEGKGIMILSNSTAFGLKMEDNYAKRGLIKGKHYDEVVTSGDLARDVFLSDDRDLKVYQFGQRHEEMFKGTKYVETTSLEEADFVYIGIPLDKNGQDSLTMEPFEAELKKLYDMEKVLICANPDLRAYEQTFDDPVVRQGSIAEYYKELGGDVEFFGKPYPEVFDFALRDVDLPDDRILMIGDTLETDILGANTYGIKSLLVLTGTARDNMREEGFDDIMDYVQEVEIVPDYVIEKL